MQIYLLFYNNQTNSNQKGYGSGAALLTVNRYGLWGQRSYAIKNSSIFLGVITWKVASGYAVLNESGHLQWALRSFHLNSKACIN